MNIDETSGKDTNSLEKWNSRSLEFGIWLTSDERFANAKNFLLWMRRLGSYHGDPFQAHSRKIQFDATMWQLIRNGRELDSAHSEISAILWHVCCNSRNN